MIIELQRYNEVGELLIEKANTGSQGCICYQNGGQKVRRTTVAVHVERNGGYRCGSNTEVHAGGLSWEP